MECLDSRSVLWILAVAALAEDIDGNGVPEVFLAQDRWVRQCPETGGRAPPGLLNVGEPILGMAVLASKKDASAENSAVRSAPRLAVGTRFGVRLFGPSAAN